MDNRSKEILIAAQEAFKIPDKMTGIEVIDNMVQDLRKAFIKGALWADDHPNVDFYIRGMDNIEDLNITEND